MILEIVSGVLIANSFREVDKSIKLNEKSLLKREQAVEKESNAYRNLKAAEEETDASLRKLYNIKRAIHISSIKTFLHVLKQISDLSFMSHLSEQVLVEESVSDELVQMNSMVLLFEEPLTDQQMILSLLFGHSAFTYAMRKESEKNLVLASQQLRMAKLIEDQAANKIILLKAITEKTDKIWALLRDLNAIFTKAIKECNCIIQRNGQDENAYSKTDLDSLKFCIQLADVIYKISKMKIVDQEGGFYQDSVDIIQKGDAILAASYDKVYEMKRS